MIKGSHPHSIPVMPPGCSLNWPQAPVMNGYNASNASNNMRSAFAWEPNPTFQTIISSCVLWSCCTMLILSSCTCMDCMVQRIQGCKFIGVTIHITSCPHAKPNGKEVRLGRPRVFFSPSLFSALIHVSRFRTCLRRHQPYTSPASPFLCLETLMPNIYNPW